MYLQLAKCRGVSSAARWCTAQATLLDAQSGLSIEIASLSWLWTCKKVDLGTCHTMSSWWLSSWRIILIQFLWTQRVTNKYISSLRRLSAAHWCSTAQFLCASSAHGEDVSLHNYPKDKGTPAVLLGIFFFLQCYTSDSEHEEMCYSRRFVPSWPLHTIHEIVTVGHLFKIAALQSIKSHMRPFRIKK